MRLRYFHLRDLPPLQDIQVVFQHEPVLQRDCAIRFVTGVNGTGKTRMLQALVEVFLSLERRNLPPFPVTLIYDLGRDQQRRTILLHMPPDGSEGAALVEFASVLPDISKDDWEALAIDWKKTRVDVRSQFVGGDMPGIGAIGAYIPNVLLTYTSGATQSWKTLFDPPPAVEDASILPSLMSGMEDEGERPPRWNVKQEIEHKRQIGSEEEAANLEQQKQQAQEESSLPSIGQLVTDDTLPLAVSAVTLGQVVSEFSERYTQQELVAAVEKAKSEGRRMTGLRGLMNTVDWLWLESMSLHITLDPMMYQRPELTPYWGMLALLFELASSVIRQPDPSQERLLCFDLFRPDPGDPDHLTAETLFEILGGEKGTVFDVFKRLRDLQNVGLLANIDMIVRMDRVDSGQVIDKERPGVCLRYDWLSDGERMYLGRMALFHLLAGEDDALMILDEPETHFNDVWKREIVDIIDSSLRDNVIDVIISTHSSIGLTDVFDTEITLLRRSPADGTIAVVRTPMQTFGASPSEIMWGVFEAKEVVGQRATEFLDMVLMVAAYPQKIEAVWSSGNDAAEWPNLTAFQELWQHVQQLPHHYESEDRLIRMLQSVRHFTQQVTGKQTVTAADALAALENRLGPGGYQFEFRRRLRALRNRDNNAASNQSP